MSGSTNVRIVTTLEEVLDLAVEAVRKQKRGAARRRFTDIPTMLLSYRGEDLVALVWPERINRDDALAAAKTCAIGFCPDMLVIAFETFHTDQRLNPVTGREWGEREMQDVADHHDGRAQGWVQDSLLVTVYNRAGDSLARSLPYRIVAKQVVWLDEPCLDIGKMDGLVPDALAVIMAQPTADVTLARIGITGADYGLNTEEMQANGDCATARLLAQGLLGVSCAVALGAERGTERERIIRRSLPGGKVIRS